MNRDNERGFALTASLMLVALLMALLSAYFLVTMVELTTIKASMDRTRGFYAAEAGLNVRAEEIRQVFQGFNLPDGVSPTIPAGELPCTGDDLGSGDYGCQSYTLQSREVSTYVTESGTGPRTLVVPRGEPFQNLTAVEYGYRVFSTAVNQDDFPEAILEMHFRSRLVPLFQFAAFYNNDLEILPGANMTLAGPVHTNGNLYLGSYALLTINGQTTVGGSLKNGRKESNTCHGGAAIYDPANPQSLPPCDGSRREIFPEELTPWNGMVRVGIDPVNVPGPETFDPTPGALYWDRADLRVVLDVNDPADLRIEVRRADGTTDPVRTAALNGCVAGGQPVVWTTHAMYNPREGLTIRMLDVHAQGLIDCAHTEGLLDAGRALNDNTEGGLVWYFGVDGPNSSTFNNYGVRVSQGVELASTVIDAPPVRGLTVVSDQAMYVKGDYNAVNKKPASFLVDSLNILSNAWDDANSGPTATLAGRIASNTTINAAFLAGVDLTGGANGEAGEDNSHYNGGLENFPRLHENWSGRTLTYRGSFVSLWTPRHVRGWWSYGGSNYLAPNRDWGFDPDLSDPANLPPLSPRFVYLRQDLFVRHFEL